MKNRVEDIPKDLIQQAQRVADDRRDARIRDAKDARNDAEQRAAERYHAALTSTREKFAQAVSRAEAERDRAERRFLRKHNVI